MRRSSETSPLVPGGQAPDWQRLGEVELRLGMDADAVIMVWLSDRLLPLNLHAGLTSQVLASAREAVRRAMQAETARKDPLARFVLLIPSNCPLSVQAWGFFRIDKAEPGVEDGISRCYLIEFYLYPEE